MINISVNSNLYSAVSCSICIVLKLLFLMLVVHSYQLAQVLGPFSDDIAAMFGNYAPLVQVNYSTSPLDGLRELADVVDFVPGCSDILCSKYDSVAVGKAAAQADTVVVCLGNGKLIVLINNNNSTIT